MSTLLEGEEKEEPSLATITPAERATRRELRRRWDKSPWRILPMPVLSYTMVGTYLWLAHFEHPWWRAAVPVIAITIYTTFSPVIRDWWFQRMRRRIAREPRKKID